jgi:tetratricopeptide (TPR) repeat protein
VRRDRRRRYIVGATPGIRHETRLNGHSAMTFMRVLIKRSSRFAPQCVAWAMILLLLDAQNAHASDLSKITGIDINIPAGTISFSTPRPDAIPDMLKNIPNDVLDLLNPYGLKLAFLIRQAQAQARNGAQPIPPNIRAQLVTFFPAYILDKVRWTVYDANRIALDSLILGSDCSDLNLPFNIDCKMGAITLDNIVVFRGAAGAQNRVSWAHELVHVSQYDSMGIDGFAFVYASPGAYSLEKQAYDWQATVQNTPLISVGVQTHWTVAPGPRTPLPANAFALASSRLLSDPARMQTNKSNGDGGIPQGCAGFPGLVGTDTGISLQDSTNHLNRGIDFEAKGKFAAAIAEYQQAVQANHTNAQAYDRLGMLLVKTGQRTEGVTQLKKAVCIDSSQASFRGDLASAQTTTAGPASTMMQRQSDVFHNPADPSGRRQLAALLRQSGDTDGAATQEWAAAQLTPPEGGPLYAALRKRLNQDWDTDVYETNPVSNVKSRKRVTLRRLDSCVLAWNELSETLNTSSKIIKSFTYTVNLGRINSQTVSLTGGNNIHFPNPDQAAVTSSLVVQVDYAYSGPWRSTNPLFALLPAPKFAEANGLLAPIREIINSCHSQ